MHESPKVLFFDRLATMVLVVVLGVTPLFLVPFLAIGASAAKMYFLGAGALLVLIFWVVARMLEGSITFPKTPLVWIAVLIPVLFSVSALFSPAPHASFGGLSLGAGTVLGMALFVLVFLESIIYLSSPRSLSLLAKILLIVTGVITVFQIAYLFLGPRFLSLGNFFTSTGNLVGGWNDLALWYGIVVIGLMLAAEFVHTASRLVRGLVIALGVCSLFMLALVNSILVWGILVVFSLVMFVYSLTILRLNKEESKHHFPIVPFVLLIVSLFFFLANPIAGGFLGQKFGAFQSEIRPSISATGTVVGSALYHHPIVGVGPDRFGSAWLMYHPKATVATQYWDSRFSSGFSFIPTLIATTGVLSLSVIAFIILFLVIGFFAAFRNGYEKRTHFHILLSFTIAFFGWIVACLYNPGVVVLAATFAATGVFVGVLSANGKLPMRTIEFLKDPRQSFFAILLLVAVLIGSLFLIFIGGEKFTSLAFYARAESIADINKISTAENLLNKAIVLYPSDVYYRARASLGSTALQQLLSNQNLSQDIIKSEFQSIFSSIESDARSAISYDSTNPDNWIALESLYQGVIPLGVSGAYDNANSTIKQLSVLLPGSPGVDLLQAQLDIANKDQAGAKIAVQAALAKKPNYIDAIFLLAQIEAAGGDSATAIKQLEQTALANPRDASVYLELGLFKYQTADFAGAVSALERSVTLDPTVANARYFLALSYAKANRTADAITVLTSLAKAIPGNATITKVIANLKAGKDALDGVGAANTAPVSETQTGNQGSTTSASETSVKSTGTGSATPKTKDK